jgi:8-oxo-dGTP pyrophosphatase MutT (NUDIX family)
LSTFARRLSNALFLAVKSGLAPVAVGVNALVLDSAGRVLLVRHGYEPGWRLPGGGVDPGETPAFAIRRELEEELNLEGGTVALIGHHARKVLWMGHLVVLYRIEGARIDFRPSFEIREICWADPDAPPPQTAPATRRRLAELRGAPVSENW